ncbi:hypothetical protein [Chenggangzhangella methanolivorans]|uniref:hypothetical protein n=1 Tax=Chenggangzhangella methanolivorans TaxID=1437009 RepID=UPI0021BDCDC6|nr:hypothetical protein [Chenggangzhangella methanolivorans]
MAERASASSAMVSRSASAAPQVEWPDAARNGQTVTLAASAAACPSARTAPEKQLVDVGEARPLADGHLDRLARRLAVGARADGEQTDARLGALALGIGEEHRGVARKRRADLRLGLVRGQARGSLA